MLTCHPWKMCIASWCVIIIDAKNISPSSSQKHYADRIQDLLHPDVDVIALSKMCQVRHHSIAIAYWLVVPLASTL